MREERRVDMIFSSNALANVEAVLFDLFDTLLIVERDKSSVKVNEECLKQVYKFLNMNGINISYENFRQAYREIRNQFYERIYKNFEEPHFTHRISQVLIMLGYNYPPNSPIVVGAANAYSEEFMRHVYPDEDAAFVLRILLKHGYKTGIISNFAIPECAHKLISLHGLKGLLNVVIISAEVNRRKPSSEIFSVALRALGVEAARSIFVGDTPDIDIRGAKAAGMKTILVERGNTRISRIEDEPDFRVSSLKEILRLLRINAS